MSRIRRHRADCAAVLAALVFCAAPAYAGPGPSPATLDHAPLNQLPRVGLVIVGARGPETLAARALAAASATAAGHQVVFLPASTTPPARPWLLALCAANDLDAVGLVRISTDAPDWRVTVDVQDPEGRALTAGFSFPMSAADVAAHERARAEANEEDLDAGEVADGPPPGPPRLWVSERFVMLGSTRIADGEFYRLVDRPDLASQHGVAIALTRSLGFAALGVGLSGALFVAVAAPIGRDACADREPVYVLVGRFANCSTSGAGLLAIPLALTAVGGGLVITSIVLARDRPSLETRKTLAREYNARLVLSAAPSLRGDGGVMMINGRF